MDEKRLTEVEIEGAIVGETYIKVGEKTTICMLRLENGFEVIGTSACVNARSYDPDIGKTYSRKRAIDKVWELEGYLAQQRKYDGQNLKDVHNID